MLCAQAWKPGSQHAGEKGGVVDIEHRLVDPAGGEEGGMNGESGTETYTLPPEASTVRRKNQSVAAHGTKQVLHRL